MDKVPIWFVDAVIACACGAMDAAIPAVLFKSGGVFWGVFATAAVMTFFALQIMQSISRGDEREYVDCPCTGPDAA